MSEAELDNSGRKAFTGEHQPKVSCRNCERVDAGTLRRCKIHHPGTGHEAGKILLSQTGTKYQVQPDGSFRRVVVAS